MALIFWMSSNPSPEFVHHFPMIAKLKVIHMVEYGILYILIRWAMKRTTELNEIEIFTTAFMLTLIYGLTDEFHQIFVQGRTARLEDVLADGVGALITQLAFMSNIYKTRAGK